MTEAQGQDSPIDWEGALVQRARSGDTRAFERLYREHAGKVYGLCLRMTRDTALAEDCTQETFVNAWRALDRFETRSSLGTWLHRIAVNVALGKRRKATPVIASESVEVEDRPSRPSGPWKRRSRCRRSRRPSAICRKAHGMSWCCMQFTATRMPRLQRCSA